MYKNTSKVNVRTFFAKVSIVAYGIYFKSGTISHLSLESKQFHLLFVKLFPNTNR